LFALLLLPVVVAVASIYLFIYLFIFLVSFDYFCDYFVEFEICIVTVFLDHRQRALWLFSIFIQNQMKKYKTNKNYNLFENTKHFYFNTHSFVYLFICFFAG
jgi:hypothetical protein